MNRRDTKEIDEETLLTHLEQRLASEFDEVVSAEEVHRTVRLVAATWADAPVRHYIPILTERAARQRLAASARAGAAAGLAKPA